MATIHIATEDQIGQAVAEKLVSQYTNFIVSLKLGLRGNGHLKSNLKSYFEMAAMSPVLLLVDLDLLPCAPQLITNWQSKVNINRPGNCLLRVACAEVEAWLLADEQAIGNLLRANKVPARPDELPDPKQTLLNLAKKAPRAIKNDLVKQRGDICSQGIGYNARLVQFVENDWDPARASTRSPSLGRACQRLTELAAAYV